MLSSLHGVQNLTHCLISNEMSLPLQHQYDRRIVKSLYFHGNLKLHSFVLVFQDSQWHVLRFQKSLSHSYSTFGQLPMNRYPTFPQISYLILFLRFIQETLITLCHEWILKLVLMEHIIKIPNTLVPWISCRWRTKIWPFHFRGVPLFL